MYECAKLLSEAGTSHVSLVTNGYLMTKDIAYQLKKNGIDRIQISIDGASPNTHDRLRNKNGAFKGNCQVVILISHKESTLKDVDMIYEINELNQIEKIY
ncbi:radical SAM protein [Thermoanaerobacterium thermosaccharolyticum]|uniref:radical SAM protein n=1 Tax=Thermoanaerobacterium thermosaccharolyticum TaxID=1517 RepID=UPI001E50126B|nr:radical SAM protein [Thermoanaerobacterium thermosaccharolyticum]